MSNESVDHPAHYGGDTPYEAIKVIEAWGLDFHLGNAVKYISRAGRKNSATEAEDLEKALWYIRRKLSLLAQAIVPAPVQATAGGPLASPAVELLREGGN